MLRRTFLIFAALALNALAAPPSLAHSDARAIEEVEGVVREYYERMAALDYAGMRALSTPQLEVLSQSTPEFEIYGEGLRMDHAQFERLIEQAKKAERKLTFQLTQFRTVVEDDVAYTSYMLFFKPDEKVGTGEVVLRRDGKRWLVDRLVHMPFYPGYPQ